MPYLEEYKYRRFVKNCGQNPPPKKTALKFNISYFFRIHAVQVFVVRNVENRNALVPALKTLSEVLDLIHFS